MELPDLINVDTDRKKILVLYLAQKLGFKDNEFLRLYLNASNIKLIEAIKTEIEFKKNTRHFKKTDGFLNKIVSASEIENYTYCPVAFAISRTFNIPENIASNVGTKLHAQQVLETKRSILKKQVIQIFGTYNTKNKEDIIPPYIFYDKNSKDFLDDISNSQLVYPELGSKLEDQRPLLGKHNWFVGKPDYIYKNVKTGKYFVVEEKFKYETAKKIPFYKNHLNQLRAYLYGIQKEDYPIEYGYLVYWSFVDRMNYYSITHCSAIKIEKNEDEREVLAVTYRDMLDTLNQGSNDFKEHYRAVDKCINCIATLFCTHKTGQHTKFKIPYSDNYFKEKYVPYPDLLNKKSLTETLEFENSKYSLYDRLFKFYSVQILQAINIHSITKQDIESYNLEFYVDNDNYINIKSYSFKIKNQRKPLNGKQALDSSFNLGFINAIITGHKLEELREEKSKLNTKENIEKFEFNFFKGHCTVEIINDDNQYPKEEIKFDISKYKAKGKEATENSINITEIFDPSSILGN